MDYKKLWRRCETLGRTVSIGKTVLNREIPLVCGGEDTLIVCATHAREHVTTEVLFRLLEKKGLACDFLPVHNVDGVLLSKYGVAAVEEEERRKKLLKINGNEDFSLWKANCNAVDLNVNFNARWGKGKRNVFFPAPENYVGPYPASEPETRAVVRLLKQKNYAQVVSYHAKGEVVYWGFFDNFAHRELAEDFAASMGYELTTAEGSCGGLKDYFDLIAPDGLGLTVELGEDRFAHPYPYAEIPRLCERLENSIEVLYENGKRLAALRRVAHG